MGVEGREGKGLQMLYENHLIFVKEPALKKSVQIGGCYNLVTWVSNNWEERDKKKREGKEVSLGGPCPTPHQGRQRRHYGEGGVRYGRTPGGGHARQSCRRFY